MKDCIVITGATASGKTTLSIKLAQKINGEIISADSRQIYIGMDIGTAKPSPEQRKIVPHYLIDIITPDKSYSAKEFSEMAKKYIEGIKSRGHIPIIVGGTGLYLKALFEGIFEHPPIPEYIREGIKEELEKKGISSLYARLKKIDPEAAGRIKPNDRQRIMRAIEVYEFTKIPISVLQKDTKPSSLKPLYIGLYVPRDILKKRIKNRVEEMFKSGFVEEVERLLKQGYKPDSPGFSSIGYKEVYKVITGEYSIDEAKEKIIKNTVQYAKRQLTWFKRIQNIHWLYEEK